MNSYAIIKDNIVINVFVVDSQNDTFAQAICEEMLADSFIFISEHDRLPSARWVLNNERLEPAKPYPSWIFNEDTFSWHAPVPFPQNDKGYKWDEESLSWVELNG